MQLSSFVGRDISSPPTQQQSRNSKWRASSSTSSRPRPTWAPRSLSPLCPMSLVYIYPLLALHSSLPVSTTCRHFASTWPPAHEGAEGRVGELQGSMQHHADPHLCFEVGLEPHRGTDPASSTAQRQRRRRRQNRSLSQAAFAFSKAFKVAVTSIRGRFAIRRPRSLRR